MNKELGPKGVAVIGVSLDDDGAEAVKPFLAKNPMEYLVALGSDAAKDKYQIGPLPTTVSTGAGIWVSRSRIRSLALCNWDFEVPTEHPISSAISRC